MNTQELMRELQRILHHLHIHMPSKGPISLHVSQLSSPAQQFLRQLDQSDNTLKRTIRGSGWRILSGLLLGTLCFVLWLLWIPGQPQQSTAEHLLRLCSASLLIFLSIMFLHQSIRRLLSSAHANLSSFSYPADFYFLQIHADQVKAYPHLLLNPEQCQIVHHHSHGLYTFSQLNLNFMQWGQVQLKFRGKHKVEHYFDHILEKRHWAFAQLEESDCQHVQGVELMHTPQQVNAKPQTTHMSWIMYSLLAFISIPASYPLHLFLCEENAWIHTRNQHHVAAYEQYLQQFPQGTYRAKAHLHREQLLFTQAVKQKKVWLLQHYLNAYPQGRYHKQAQRGIRILYHKAIQAYRKRAGYITPEKKYLLDILRHLKHSQHANIFVRLTSKLDLAPPSKKQRRILDATLRFSISPRTRALLRTQQSLYPAPLKNA
ncbi:MAG: hypothetical protein AAGJ35_09865, partial [Myxococcota bacterium]